MQFKKCAIAHFLICAIFVLLESTNSNGDEIVLSGRPPTNVIVPPSGSLTTTGFNTFNGRTMVPTNNVGALTEEEENPFAFYVPKDGTVSSFSGVVVVSSNTLALTLSGSLAVEFRFRRANASQPFVDTTLGYSQDLPSGNLNEYRFNVSDLVNNLIVRQGDRVTLQIRVSCPVGCDDIVYLTWSLTASALFLPSIPDQGCPANTLCVIPSTGNDSLGVVGGFPFATIQGALLKAQSGNVVLISPGTYSESFTIPTGVTVAGMSVSNVFIQQLGVSTDTDLVTMGVSTALQQLTLRLVGVAHVRLRGLVFPSGTAVASQARQVIILVDNSAAGAAGTSDVTGVYASGVGWNGVTFADAHLQLVTIAVSSNGNGNKRGILVEFSSGTLNVGVVRSVASNASSTGGAGTYIGVETNSSSSHVQARFAVFGGATADVSQTLGSITLGFVQLLNFNANSKGIGFFLTPTQKVYSSGGTLPVGTNYYVYGSTGAQATEFFLPVTQTTLYTKMVVHSSTGPSAGNTCTWTLRRNAVATAFTLTAVEAVTDLVLNTISIRFSPGDLLSVQVVCSGLLGITETSVTFDLY